MLVSGDPRQYLQTRASRPANERRSMHKFDRRDWLRMAGFLTGATIASRSLLAGPTQAPASGASRNRLIQLSLNVNPFGPAPSVVAALREFP